MFHDLLTASRALWRRPLFLCTAAGSLALGIAACTVIFSVVYTLLLRPPRYPQPERLVHVGTHPPLAADSVYVGLAPVAFEALAHDPQSGFSGLGGFWYDYTNLTGVPTPAQLLVGVVTGDYFSTLGVPPRLGRAFTAADCREASPPTVLLGDELWRTKFNAREEIVGQTITLDDKPRTVIGVMPPGFKNPSGDTDLWLPLAEDGQEMQPGAPRNISTVGRLARGGDAAWKTVRARLDGLAASLAQNDPKNFKDMRFDLQPLASVLVDHGTREALWLLLGAVGCVLLVTCANVANLQLVRAAGRRRETGVRLALGASRARIMREALTESLLLSLAGGALGVLGAAWGVDAVAKLLPPGSSPWQDDVGLSWPVLGFALAISGLTGVLTGLLPAWSASRENPAGSLAAGAGARGASEGPGGIRLRAGLVVTEIALALVLLAGAGLMGRTFLATVRTAAGMRTERTLLLNFSCPDARYTTGALRAEYLRRMLESIDAVPGVAGTAITSTEPFNWWISMNFRFPGQDAAAPEVSRQTADYDAINPAFFSTLDIPILQGRAFDARDTGKAPPVVIVNEAFARRYLGGRRALGERIALVGTKNSFEPEIVGVAADVRREGLDKPAPPQMYVCALQRPTDYVSLFVRAAGNLSAQSLTRPVEAAIWKVDADQPIGKVTTLDQVIDKSISSIRLYIALFGTFAGVALTLAALGIYGTISYSVGQRTREFGIRLALGAQRRDVLRLVLRQGTRLILAGIVLGVAASLGLARLVASLLYGVDPRDPLTLVLVAVVLGAVALLASYLPARRATRIDPLTALREE